MKTTSLAPIEALNVQPKPRKADIIAALVERARQKYNEERDAHLKLVEAAEKEVEELVLHLLKIAPKNHFKRVVKISQWSSAPEVEFTLETETPAITAAIAKFKELSRQCPRGFDADETKKRIISEMDNTSDRVNAILKDQKMVKALDKILTSIA